MIETRVTGSGTPVTIFAHGLGASIDETRAFGSGVPGSKVFFQFPGHGATSLDWYDRPVHDGRVAGFLSYGKTAGILDEIATSNGAGQAVGISLGASVLLHLLAASPARFDRVALLLPASLDRPREVRRSGIPVGYAELLSTPPVVDVGALRNCEAPVLVVGQEGDTEHPAIVAEEIASAFPDADLRIFPPGGLLVAHRARLRALLGEFLRS